MLQGDQVTLRPMRAGDLDALVTLFAEPEVARWWPGENLARLQARLTDDGFRDVGVMRRYERANDGTWRDSLLMDLLADELTP